jgi:hypothetical protein
LLCPACHDENPDRSRFCGQCGTPLRDLAPARPSFPLQDVIVPRRGANGDADRSGSRPRTVEPLPKEVIDYDNGLPLLAEPGMDRRRQTPDAVRQAMQAVWGDAASVHEREAPTPLVSEAAVPEDLWNPAVVGETGRRPGPAPSADFAHSGVEELTPPANVPAPSPDSAPPDGAKDLSRFLDFTPAHHDKSGSLSGPSFLGLSGDAETMEPEDEPKARRWPHYAAMVVAIGFSAALVMATAMHWTSVSGAASRVYDAASRYARVGATYIQLLRTGKTDSSAKSTEPSSASASPASNQKAAPNFVVEQPPTHPAQAAGGEASAGVPKTTVEPPAPESPAPSAGSVPLNSTALNAAAKGERQAVEPKQAPDSRIQPKAVERKQLANAKPRSAAPKPSARQSSKLAAGQAEYQQALATKNPEIARALLWRATALGNSDAQVRLADMYIYGQGVPQNCDQGLILLRSAAQKANPHAQSKLGVFYATGKCVSQDRVQAYRWLTRAFNNDQSSEWTEKNRETVWRQMSPEERSRTATAKR